MVPLRGFAPRSPLYKSGSLLLAYRGVKFGGADETQTDDHSTYPKLMVEKIGCAPTFPECKSGVLTSYTISPYFLFHFSILSNNSSNVILDFLYFEEFLLCCINSQLAGCDIILGSILFIKPSYTEYM